MGTKSRYPRIYEANPSGPPITREDFLKTTAALRGVLALLRLAALEIPENEAAEVYKQIGRSMSAHVGRQWSVLTAMQYLTGQRADKAVRHWSEAFDQAGLKRARIDALIAVANHFCANGMPGKTLSAGLLVSDYKNRHLPAEVVRDLLGLPEDIFDQVISAAG